MELKFRPILMNHGRDLLQKVPWHTANPTALIEFYLVFFGTNVWNPNLMNVSIVQYLDKFTFCTENMNMGSKAVSSRPPTPGHCSWSSIWALLPHHWVFPHLLLGLSVRCPGSVIFAGEWLKLFAEPVIWQSMLRLSFSLSSIVCHCLFVEGMLVLEAQSEFELVLSCGAGLFTFAFSLGQG